VTFDDTPADTQESAQIPQGEPGTTDVSTDAPARATRGGRRRKAAADQPEASGEASGDSSGESSPAGDEGDQARQSRTRSARKQPTPARRRAASDEAQAAAVEDGAAEPGEQAPARRRRGAKKAAAAEATASEAATDAGSTADAGPEVEAEAGETSGSSRAATMPLFQAPEPAASRPRRAATRPAGPPRIESADAPSDAPAEAVPAAADDTSADDTSTDADEAVEDDEAAEGRRRRRRRGGRGRRSRSRSDAEAGASSDEAGEDDDEDAEEDDVGGDSTTSSRRRRRRRRRGSGGGESEPDPDDPPNTVVRVREPRRDDVSGVRGSTRLEAKKQRRREGREAGRRRTVLSEAEFLARRESVQRVMVIRERDGRTQIGVLEDGVLVEHYVARRTQTSMVGNVYLGKVQNVLPSMEAAFVDIGRGRNAVLYAGEVNWDTAGLDGQPRRIEHALKSGESVMVQVTKDPIGHKGARLTSQISLPGRYLVFVPEGSMTGISRKLPDTERSRLKKVLRDIVPEDAGVIVRTAAEGASETELERDVSRLRAQWDDISGKAQAVAAPSLLYGEPDLAIRVVRDIFNEDISTLMVSGEEVWDTLEAYIGHVAPDLVDRLQRWDSDEDVFAAYRIDEQLLKALDRKVWLPSGGSLVIDRTEAMTVIDVNTGRFTGSGGNLEETVTKNNLEAAEEIVRQLRLRDIGGIIVIDFIDMVLESNRDLVLRRLVECLGRDRTKHQVAEVTSLGLVQMTRKRVGQGLIEVFSEPCEACGGRGVIVHEEPVEKRPQQRDGGRSQRPGRRSGGGRSGGGDSGPAAEPSPAVSEPIAADG
jgi:ribonuclease E